MPPLDGTPVPGAHHVLRVPVPPKDFTPEGWRPTHHEFEPSGQDKQDADERGTPIRVSVWDSVFTRPDEARAFRDREVLLLTAVTANVMGAGAAAVVYDSLPPPLSTRPGAAGHAGIEGLDRPSGEPKTQWRARLQRIADAFAVLKAG